jgi:hypothetical protein
MFARSTTFKGKPSAVDAGVALVREKVMPAVSAMPDFVGLSMLVDRDSGSCITTTAWATEQGMLSSDQQVAPLRDRAMQIFGDRPEVRQWEIAVLHRAQPSGDGACARPSWRTCPASAALRC